MKPQDLVKHREIEIPPAAVRRALGRSIWLLLLLSEWTPVGDADVRGGTSIRAGELAEALGIGERQVRRELQKLRKARYVRLRNTGRGFRIRLLPRSSR